MRIFRMVGPFAIAIFVILQLTMAAGCGIAESENEWDENVPLSNGRTLLVHRDLRYGVGGIGEPHGPLGSASLAFEFSGKKYRWSGDFQIPIMLQLGNDGNFYIATRIPNCESWRELNEPSSVYLMYKSSGENWMAIEFDDFQAENKANLSPGKKDKDTPLYMDPTNSRDTQKIFPGAKIGCNSHKKEGK